MAYEMILYDKTDGIATITFNRLTKRNAITIQMRNEIITALEDSAEDESVRVIIITGGNEIFCAGADIKSPPTPKTMWDKISPKRTYSYYHLIEDIGKPVIAAIAGYCLGGGLEMASTCDIRIAADNALIGDAHSKLGIIGGGGSTQRITRLIGVAKAKELIFSGEPIDAIEAEKIGLVNKVVPVADLQNEALKLAKLYKSRSPMVLKLSKYAIDAAAELNMAQGLDYEAKCATILTMTEDFKEGMQAFLEKRKPAFTGK